MYQRWHIPLIACCAVTMVAAGSVPSIAQAEPPGAPGVDRGYAPSDKQGFGTSRSQSSPVWFTLGRGGTTEIFYPNLSTPASRHLQLVVSDGQTFAQRLSDVPTTTEPVSARTPSYRQVSNGNGWKATATYVTDPERSSVTVNFSLRSKNGKPLHTYVVHEPTLSKDGNDDQSRSDGQTLVASDANAASALRAAPGFAATSSGYLGTSDGWTDLSQNNELTAQYPAAGPGNIGQVGKLPVDGVRSSDAVVTLGFGGNESEAMETAKASEQRGFGTVAQAYADGWLNYTGSLNPAPNSVTTEHHEQVYWSSILALAASEDKHRPGAFVASPSEPWAFRENEEVAPEPGPYHLVWPRDLYQHATALIAAGDDEAAHRSWDFLMSVQAGDGHFPQNTETTGEPYWEHIQLDETALPIVLAWQLDRSDQKTVRSVRAAADFLVNFSHDGYDAPYTEQERWENQSGYSPATIASAVAGLVCAADMMEAAGDGGKAEHYRAVADEWQSNVEKWTMTSTGPHSEQPYYLRVTKDGKPNEGTKYNPGDNYPREVDQRAQVDPSFLELVRLGVKRHDDPVFRNSIEVIDEQLSEKTPVGRHWHRFTHDGYGEREDGGQWDVGKGRTYGRLWPIFAGERGEYELLAGQTDQATDRLGSIARTANEGLMLSEQVWGNRAPAGGDGPEMGSPNRSATPLTWTHGQFVRLAWSIERGAPVERPSVVADRYAQR